MYKLFKHLIIFTYILYYLSCFSLGEKVTYEVNDIKNQASENSKTANYFLNRYEYDKALDFFNKALNLNIMVDNISGIIKNYVDIGKVYLLKKNYNQSLNFLISAENIIKINRTYKEEQAYLFATLGEYHYNLKNYDKSREYFNKAIDIENSLGNIENNAMLMQSIAKIERSTGNIEGSLNSFLKAAKILQNLYNTKRLRNIKNLSLIYYSIGQSYSKLNKYDHAGNYIRKALYFDKLIENPNGIADDYYALAVINEKLAKSIDRVLFYYEKSRAIYRFLDDVNQYTLLTNITANLYYKKNDFRKYYEYKSEEFKLNLYKTDIQKKIINEIFELMDHKDINGIFTKEEIKIIKDKYLKELANLK
ncbi:MAG: tetratricopeptide repeat protein [Spirochaetes bacterium]|nr:tetratricopeptide repeat protein [Spirochaetota bacterium]